MASWCRRRGEWSVSVLPGSSRRKDVKLRSGQSFCRAPLSPPRLLVSLELEQHKLHRQTTTPLSSPLETSF
jgi:hypothetical protein